MSENNEQKLKTYVTLVSMPNAMTLTCPKCGVTTLIPVDFNTVVKLTSDKPVEGKCQCGADLELNISKTLTGQLHGKVGRR